MKCYGFKRYGSLSGVEFMPAESDISSGDVKSPVDSLLDFIFSRDPITGFPVGDLSMYLSDKTSDEVRSFIEAHLMSDLGNDNVLDLDTDIRSEMKKLPSDFLAACSRDRFEDIESYEARISNYISSVTAREKAEDDWSKSPLNPKNKKDAS